MSRGDSSRLERALEVWLAHVETSAHDDDALLAAHPELRELLEPMLGERDGAATARVIGDFRIDGELGRGGMGVVYSAWQQSLGRKVALKILAPALGADSAAIARFHREAAATAKLRHPGIVEVFGVGRDGDVNWFAMELVEGEPLHRCRERFRDPRAAVELAARILDALQHAHATGLVHRDVKPANVLVRTDGQVVLTDFGLARDVSSPTVTVEGGFLGTLDYAAPEQIQGQKVDARVDVWSTGVVLAELLAGRHPFTADTATATLRAILTQDPTGLHSAAGIDDDLAAICARALEKDPERRYASAVAFLADLRAWQQGLPVAARLPSATERLRRWARREPWRALAAALLAIGVPLLAVVGGYLWANAPRIEAAARAERAERRERALTTAWVALNDERPRDGLRELEPWVDDPTDLEVRLAQCALWTWTETPAKALTALAPFTGTRIHDLVTMLLDGGGKELPFRFEEVEASTPLECAVLGHLAYEQVRSYHRDPVFYKHAAKWYGRAVALSPKPRAWLLLQWSIAAARADDVDAFATALAAYEHFFPDTRGLQLLYAFGSKLAPVERGLAVLAAPDLDGDPRFLFARGQFLARTNRTSAAIDAMERALAVQPDNTRGWEQLARLRRSIKDRNGALEALRRAIAIDPKYAAAIGLLGAILTEAGSLPEARTALERARELDPREWRNAHNLGLLLHELRDDEGALAQFEAAARLAPTEAAPHACMARTLKRLDRIEEAFVEEVRASTVASPDDYSARMMLALRALEVDLPAVARDAAESAVRIAPDNDGTWWRLAEVCLEIRPIDAAGAAAAVERARAVDKAITPRERALWGRAEAANGNVQAAIDLLETALREEDKLPPASREKARAALARLREPR